MLWFVHHYFVEECLFLLIYKNALVYIFYLCRVKYVNVH